MCWKNHAHLAIEKIFKKKKKGLQQILKDLFMSLNVQKKNVNIWSENYL